MNNLIEQVKDQQEVIKDLQKKAERNSGKEEQLLKRLQTEFQISSKKEAEELLQGFLEEKKENEMALEKIKKEFEEIIAKAEPNSRTSN